LLLTKLNIVKIGTGGDHDSTHSADVDYAELIPLFLTLNSVNFYMQMANENNPEKALKLIGENIRPNQRVYIGAKRTIAYDKSVWACRQVMTDTTSIVVNTNCIRCFTIV